MKSIVQNYGKGELAVTDVPIPALQPGGILVRNAVSLISAGTEKLMVDLAQKSLAGKAKERPDLVRKVLDKVRKDGLMATLETVRSRLDAPIPLGYSCAGRVIAVGADVDTFQIGDRVACAGAGYANHAEVVFVPKHLAVTVPPSVSAEKACFTTVGAIALQGLRLAKPELGETVAVIGLGLVGLLAAQLARAAGCRVVGMDLSSERCRQAMDLGIDDAVTDGEQLAERCRQLTAGHGADKVIVAASTKSSQPIALAGEISRQQGIVAVVGAVGMDVPRQPYYDKELVLRVSRSYGAGRYDPEYEEKGRDYPIGYVRWTENRNMEAFVQQLARGAVQTEPLVSHRFDIGNADQAYGLISGKGQEPYLGILLQYPEAPEDDSSEVLASRVDLTSATASARRVAVGFGVLGAGQFASGVLLPALDALPDVRLVGVATATGIKAQHVAKKHSFAFATTDGEEILAHADVDAVLIATRHHLHADQVLAAIDAGKHVFVEKPLCLHRDELAEISEARRQVADPTPLLMVGFNRRFAPMAQRLHRHFKGVDEALVMHYRVNAGYIPLDHWTQDIEQGGGRILGEVCHFVDFLTFLAGAPPVSVSAQGLSNGERYRDDNLVATLAFENGSIGTITYVANGAKGLAKEYVEVSGGGRSAVLDNFRRLELYDGGRRQVEKARWRQDKGHRDQLAAFVAAVQSGGPPPIPWMDIVRVTETTFDIVDRLHSVDTGPVDTARSDAPRSDAPRSDAPQSDAPQSDAPQSVETAASDGSQPADDLS